MEKQSSLNQMVLQTKVLFLNILMKLNILGQDQLSLNLPLHLGYMQMAIPDGIFPKTVLQAPAQVWSS